LGPTPCNSFFDQSQLSAEYLKLKITQVHSQHYLKMTFTSNSSNVNELSTPLLSKRPHHESDEEQGCILYPSLTLAIFRDDDDDEGEPCQKAAEDESQWRKLFVGMVVLSALLFLPFGVAISMSPVEATTALQLSAVNYTIVMFVVNAALYRQIVQDFQITCLVARLLPESIIGIVMGLVFCGQVVPACLLLLSSTLCMAVVVAVCSIYFLVAMVAINSEASPEEDYDEK
jgi:hypothetical protein